MFGVDGVDRAAAVNSSVVPLVAGAPEEVASVVATWSVPVVFIVEATVSQRTPVQPAVQLHANARYWLTHASSKQLATARSAACDARLRLTAQSTTQLASLHPPGRISSRQLVAVPDEQPASAAQNAYWAMHCAEHDGASMSSSSQLTALEPQGELAHDSGGAGLVIGLGSAVVVGDAHTAAWSVQHSSYAVLKTRSRSVRQRQGRVSWGARGQRGEWTEMTTVCGAAGIRTAPRPRGCDLYQDAPPQIYSCGRSRVVRG